MTLPGWTPITSIDTLEAIVASDADDSDTVKSTDTSDCEGPISYDSEIYVRTTDGALWAWKPFMGPPTHWAPRARFQAKDTIEEAERRIRDVLSQYREYFPPGTAPRADAPWEDILSFLGESISREKVAADALYTLRWQINAAFGDGLSSRLADPIALVTEAQNERRTVIRGLLSALGRATVSPEGRDLISGHTTLEAVANDAITCLLKYRQKIRLLQDTMGRATSLLKDA